MTADARIFVPVSAIGEMLAARSDGMLELVGPAQDGDAAAWLGRHGRGIRAAVCLAGSDRFDLTRLDALPDLERVIVFGAGMENVDLAAAAGRGIVVTNAGDAHAGEVADHALALMLASWRLIPQGDAWVRQGRWLGEGRMAMSRSVGAARVGIVGLGNIGTAIAARVEPFGCEIAWWGPRDKPGAPWKKAESVVTLADQSDILFVAPRTDDSSRGLIDAAVIAALGVDGLLVNVSRGFVVDEKALIAALRSGALGGAALDVFDPEPMDPDRWAGVPNALFSPHNGGATPEAVDRIADKVIRDLEAFLAG